MDFERGQDIKETLKLGRKANALKIEYMDIHGEAAFPVKIEMITNEVAIKYNFNPDIAAIKMPVNFIIGSTAIRTALQILSESGISKRFHEYMEHLILMRAPDKIQKFPDIPFNSLGEIIPNVRFVLIKPQIQLTFKLTGKDLLYMDDLYRIAEPADGY
jgi:hypothetical protein